MCNRKSGIVLACVVLVAVSTGIALRLNQRPGAEELLREARKAMLRGDATIAAQKTQLLLQSHPRNSAALLLAAQLAVETSDDRSALDHLANISDDGSRTSIDARMLAGNTLLFRLFSISAAEEQFNRALAMDRRNLDARNRLAWLLGFSGRTQAANHQILQMIRRDAFEFVHLVILCLDHDRIREEHTLTQWTDASPDDPHVLLAQAAFAQTAGEHRKAEKLAATVIRMKPGWADAAARRGESLLQLQDWSALQNWESLLPRTVGSHPNVLAIRGLKAKAENNLLPAAVYFHACLKQMPSNRRINYHLGLLLQQAGGVEQSTTYLHRATQMEAYEREAKSAWNTQELSSMEECARLANEIGLDAECYAWCVVAAQHRSSLPWIKNELKRRFMKLPTLAASRRLPSTTDMLSDFDNLVFNTTGQPAPSVRDASTAWGNAVFQEEASGVGLDFSYNNGGTPNDGAARLLETLGGGVGVIDLDMDGFPDLYFPQGGSFPVTGGPTTTRADQIYRNTLGKSFRNASVVAGIRDSSFSTGVSVGDYNNDGFPDLYVGNIGTNQLYRNNGDGTFTDVSSHIHGDAQAWSTSAVIADLNNDTFPDIYSVNYLAGDDVLTRVCESNGVPTSCLPQLFDSAQDQLFLGDGQGGFTDATEQCGLNCDGGNGLGVIAADFEMTGKLNLFVANDVAPNFYFRQSPNAADFRFLEDGVARGLAVNGDAKNEACMGVAAGDVDGNGLLDVFVTNFENESNTLYSQIDRGFFVDGTTVAALTAASRPLLGFGTALLDSDLDGDLDLFVANGHINKYGNSNRPYRMLPQFFLNRGTGEFREHDSGPYFSVPQLGRGVAKLDWNKDGKSDVVLSDLASGVHLLTNCTHDSGNWLALRLVGIRGSRDAVGATVQVVTPGQIHESRYHLTAGAYLSSNENHIVIGLGTTSELSKVTVTWPSGQSTTLVNVAVNSFIIVQEGRSVGSRRPD